MKTQRLRPRVLIVEDSVDFATLVAQVLSRMELDVRHVTHGEDALGVFEEEKPDVVLLDLALPDMSGWRLLDAIHERQRGGRDPLVIVMTAYGDPTNRLMGKLQAVYDYLVKPCLPEQVRSVVREALAYLDDDADEYA